MAVFIALVSVLGSMSSVYAEYEDDDDIVEFCIELYKKYNAIAIVKRNKDAILDIVKNPVEYFGPGGEEKVIDLALANVENYYTDTQAALQAAKVTYNNMSSAQKQKIIDFYNSVDINANFNIDIDLFNDLGLNLFQNDVISNYNYAPSSSRFGYQIMSITEFKTKFAPSFFAIADDTVSVTFISSVVDKMLNDKRYFTAYAYKDSFLRTGYGIPEDRRGFYDREFRLMVYKGDSAESYAFFNPADNLVSFPPHTRSSYSRYDSYDDTFYYTSASTGGATYIQGGFDSEAYPVCNLVGKYYLSDFNFSAESVFNNYINNYNIQNIKYVPYTPDVHPNSDIPDDEDWINNLKTILMDKPVPTVSLPEPTVPPTAPPTAQPTTNPVFPTIPPYDGGDDEDGKSWFDRIIDYFLSPLSDFLSGFWERLSNFILSLFTVDDDYYIGKFEHYKGLITEKVGFSPSWFDDIANLQESASFDYGLSVESVKVGSYEIDVSGLNFVDYSIFENFKNKFQLWIKGFFALLILFYNLEQAYFFIRGVRPFDATPKPKNRRK